MRQQTVQRVLLALVAITLLFAFSLDSFLTIEPVASDDIVSWDSGWTISEGGKIVASDVTLPYSLDGPYRDRTWQASRIMPDRVSQPEHRHPGPHQHEHSHRERRRERPLQLRRAVQGVGTAGLRRIDTPLHPHPL
ncbi:MAG: hypothetical protein ACOXZ7_03120 [Sphaerochaeta sp.]